MRAFQSLSERSLCLAAFRPSLPGRPGGHTVRCEFQARTCVIEGEGPAVAGSPRPGNSWRSGRGQQDHLRGILGRFFARTGAAAAGPVQVNKHLPPDQYDAAVAVDTAGNTIVVWSEVAEGNSEIYGQRFKPKRRRSGTAIKVNLDAAGGANDAARRFPALAASQGRRFRGDLDPDDPAGGTNSRIPPR